jgi:hypothetical protein
MLCKICTHVFENPHLGASFVPFMKSTTLFSEMKASMFAFNSGPMLARVVVRALGVLIPPRTRPIARSPRTTARVVIDTEPVVIVVIVVVVVIEPIAIAIARVRLARASTSPPSSPSSLGVSSDRGRGARRRSSRRAQYKKPRTRAYTRARLRDDRSTGRPTIERAVAVPRSSHLDDRATERDATRRRRRRRRRRRSRRRRHVVRARGDGVGVGGDVHRRRDAATRRRWGLS